MPDPMPGISVLLLHGPFAGHSGLVASVSNTEIVVKIELFGYTTPITCTPKDIVIMDQISSLEQEAMAESLFHVSDTIFIHQSAYGQPDTIGQIGSVIAVLPELQKCTVRLDEQHIGVFAFSQLSLIKPERRPPDEDYLKAISSAIPMRGYGPRLTRWWQEQADKKIWLIEEMPGLHAAFLAFQARIDAEIAAEIERQHHLFRKAFSGLTHSQKIEKWRAEWFSWTEFRSFLQPYLEPTPEERLQQAIFGAEQETPEENEKDEEHRSYHHSGIALQERCKAHMAHLDQAGYAYDTIPTRPISVSIEATSGSAPSQIPLVPVAPLPPGRPSLLEREQALAALQEEGELFRAALVSLASSTDEQTVATLLAKLANLKSLEGFDPVRWKRQKQLELALLATQQEEAVLIVLHELLQGVMSLPYRVQGVMLKGGISPLFWDENPWQITANDTVESAITRIWAPVAHAAPCFVSLLTERIIGLALVKREVTDAPCLAYLSVLPVPSYQLQKAGLARTMPEQTTLQTLLDWLDQGYLSLFVGDPPRTPNNDHTEQVPTFRLPLALREFFAIHSRLSNGSNAAILRSDEMNTLLSGFLDGMTEDNQSYYLNRFHMRNPGLFPQQFVMVGHDGSGNISVFDRDLLDERLDPQVAQWDHETWEVTPRKPFWSWFDDYIPSCLNLLEE